MFAPHPPAPTGCGLPTARTAQASRVALLLAGALLAGCVAPTVAPLAPPPPAQRPPVVDPAVAQAQANRPSQPPASAANGAGPPAANAAPQVPLAQLNQLAPHASLALLAYADRVRTMPAAELSAEITRLGEPAEQPTQQMQLAIALVQTRQPADAAKAQTLLQRLLANPTPAAVALHPLARLLAARVQEHRRIEDERDKQAQQLREAQRRIEALNDRLEALRAIERSVSRPATPAPVVPGAAGRPRAWA